MARYPRTPAEAADRWRQRIKFDLLLLKTADKKEDKKEGKEAIDKLTPPLPQQRQAVAPDRRRRTAGDVPQRVHHGVRSAHRLHVAQDPRRTSTSP